MTKKLSQEFSRTESRILGALSKLDEFLLNPQIRTFSGATPGTFRSTGVENQEPSGDRSQNDPLPEVEFSACHASNLTDSDPDETSHIDSLLNIDGIEMNCITAFCSNFQTFDLSFATIGYEVDLTQFPNFLFF